MYTFAYGHGVYRKTQTNIYLCVEKPLFRHNYAIPKCDDNLRRSDNLFNRLCGMNGHSERDKTKQF